MYDDIYRNRTNTSSRETKSLGSIDEIIFMVDGMLNTSSKRHIVGGILLSVSLLFGGLALTTMTIKEEKCNGSEE